MPENYAPEYTTPELSRSYIDSILGGIDDQSRVDEGRAHAEAESRGLGGQAYEGSAIGQVRAGTQRAKAGAISDFNLEVANKKYSERMTDTARGWQVEDRDFGAVDQFVLPAVMALPSTAMS